MTFEERSAGVLTCIQAFIKANGYPPTLREISVISGVGAPSTVSVCVAQLIGEGRLRSNGRPHRNLIPTETTSL